MESGDEERERYSERNSDFQSKRVSLQLGNMPADSKMLFVWMSSED